jgi:NTE family protein
MGVKTWKPNRARCHRFILCLILIVTAGQPCAFCRQLDPVLKPTISGARRPRIGLVLSGGGARGLAHIGVIEWLEEHRIPVDYISGASMGAIVGAMYAMDNSPKELRDLVETLDFDKLLSGPPSYDELSFRRKEDRRAYPTGLEMGARDGLRLPAGVSSGHYIGLLLDRLTLPFSTIKGFDELPIPFACVATDMLAAETVVLRKGSLTQALRASMAIPGVFTPTEIDGRVLADGGLLNNIPTDVAREMGADLIIAVNVGTPLGNRRDIDTLPGLLNQAIDVTIAQSERRNLKLADFVIAPELGTYLTLNFKAAEDIINLGYKGAEAQGTRLLPLSLDEHAWQQYLATRHAKKRTSVPKTKGLLVTGVTGAKANEIRERLKDDVGSQADVGRLERKLSEIRGGGRYESLGYDILPLYDADRLRIRVREKSYGPPFIIPVLQVRSESAARLNLSAGFRLINFDVGGYNSELRTDVLIGADNLLAVEYYRPVGRAGFFVSPRTFFSSQRMDLYNGRNREAEYLVDQGGVGIDASYIFNPRTEVRMGYELARLNARVDIGSHLLPNVRGNASSVSTRFIYDGQDSAVVPNRGARMSSELRWYFDSPGASGSFTQAVIEASAFKSVGEQNIIFSFGGGGTTFGGSPGPVQQFTLGGLRRLSAFGRGELRGDRFAYGGAGYLYHAGSASTLFIRRIYVGGWLEGGSAFFRRRDSTFDYDGAGAFIVQTPLGPMTLGGALGEGGHRKAFFSFGRSF